MTTGSRVTHSDNEGRGARSRAITHKKFPKKGLSYWQGFAREWRLRHQEAEPNAENATLEELRVAMEGAPNRRSYIRLAVMRSLLMGLERSVVAQQFCRSDRVVRLWIAMFNLGGIDALTTKRPAGRGRRVKLERLRDLLVPVLRIRAKLASFTGRESSSMDISRSSSVSRWVTAPQCAISMSLATICECLGPGRNAKMKSNAMLS